MKNPAAMTLAIKEEKQIKKNILLNILKESKNKYKKDLIEVI